MQCPVCPTSTLVMSERQGIEIDYCPTCRGVWLDRGELDKIIERSTAATASPQPPTGTVRHHDSSGRLPAQGQGPYKKKSWLRELFD